MLNYNDTIEKLVKKSSLRSNIVNKKNDKVSNLRVKNQELANIEEVSEKNKHNKEIKKFYETTEECMKKIPKLKHPSKQDLDKLSVDVINTEGKKIVVFDLDETLVHCETNILTNSEIILKVNSPKTDITKIGINKRPFIIESLQEIKKFFLIFIFTASQQVLGDIVLDYLDPEKKLFDMRLYRNNCYQTKINNETFYIKDLRILKKVNLKDVVIVDNSVLSFSFHLDNGIPILPYYNNKKDTELIILVNYLKHLFKFDDMRIENRRNIRLELLYIKANNEPFSSEDSHHITGKQSINEKELEIRKFSSENSNFSNFSNEVDFLKKSDDSERISFRNSSNNNKSDRTFKDTIIHILDEYKKNFKQDKVNYKNLYN